MIEFLSMGGYAVYVWSSYFIVTAVLVFNFVYPMRALRQLQRRLVIRHRHGESAQ
ncbi:heme exporter protein D [Natronocella acetinitrilica]|jgi:heme exporter protein D|uniref:Heme exporter protein D n=1 Tax=Natronocella acetinitrilica TaxID=414046 RepID=A0AAE3G564_9GAMM|nr:heme exporter protein CcmD [Natronocella acetinitrilica]MCP1675849.1 heme exporter protein D [Natronocella acetinitrilica]